METHSHSSPARMTRCASLLLAVWLPSGALPAETCDVDPLTVEQAVVDSCREIVRDGDLNVFQCCLAELERSRPYTGDAPGDAERFDARAGDALRRTKRIAERWMRLWREAP